MLAPPVKSLQMQSFWQHMAPLANATPHVKPEPHVWSFGSLGLRDHIVEQSSSVEQEPVQKAPVSTLPALDWTTGLRQSRDVHSAASEL